MQFQVSNVKSPWLAKKYNDMFQSNSKQSVNGFRRDVIQDIRVDVTTYQAYRVKKTAMMLLQSKQEEHYVLLWDFAEKMTWTNPGSTVVNDTQDRDGCCHFDKIYRRLNALKVGFLNGCRPIIGVNGCFLKTPYGWREYYSQQ